MIIKAQYNNFKKLKKVFNFKFKIEYHFINYYHCTEEKKLKLIVKLINHLLKLF
jgi:hypothetical protein